MEENTLEQFHKQQNFNNMEGHSGQCFEEHQFLSKLIQEHKDITDLRILEIGFNAGNSSDNFLSSHPTCKVVSFDIGEYNYVLKCKEYIDAK
jgi:predicted O-methyltransferase YrrM